MTFLTTVDPIETITLKATIATEQYQTNKAILSQNHHQPSTFGEKVVVSNNSFIKDVPYV